MKAADLTKAVEASNRLATLERIHARLVAGEALHLTVGEGSKASEIVLAPGFVSFLRDELSGGLANRIKAARAELEAMGVER